VLLVSRSPGLFPPGKWFLRVLSLRRCKVKCTCEDGDSLNRVINFVKPQLVLFDSAFYADGPRRVGLLLKDFPYLNIAIFNLDSIAAEKAVEFKLFGAKSYINLREGFGSFRRGLKKALRGESYLSPEVMKAYENLPDEMPGIRLDATRRQEEVKQLVLRGLTSKKIAEELGVSLKTITNHLSDIYKVFNVENRKELMRLCLSGNTGGMNVNQA
jgi:DNA-binding NarL/FixJ family response regulator